MSSVFERLRGGEVRINLGANVATPERAMFADSCSVDANKDGVRIMFSTTHPVDATRALASLEISFPRRSFYGQLYRSIAKPPEESGPNAVSFLQTVEQNLARIGEAEVKALPSVTTFEKVAAIRANFCFIAIHEDDAALDFLHLDAATIFRAKLGQRVVDELRAQVRVVVSLGLLLHFLRRCVEVADLLVAENPSVAEALEPQ